MTWPSATVSIESAERGPTGRKPIPGCARPFATARLTARGWSPMNMSRCLFTWMAPTKQRWTSSRSTCLAMTHSEIASAAPPGEVTQVVEHFFRHEAGKMISTLTRIFGIEHLNRAEDVVQETLVRALQTWPYYGMPKNPSAWITQVAKNLALDLIRRDKVFRIKENEIAHLMQQVSADSNSAVAESTENGITDDRLRMMFTCCHPLIAQEMQVALALKTLCGFSPAEIARAFLTSEAAIAKRLTRAKQRIREARIVFEIPAGEELVPRVNSVLQSLYLLFNEGYKASGGEQLIR